MQRYIRFFICFLCLAILIVCVNTNSTLAINNEDIINTNNSSDGYFSVCYHTTNPSKMKIGVTFDKKTVYYDYTVDETSFYAFVQGNGTYTITLYSNIKGTMYRKATSKIIDVELDNPLSPYLVSTREIMFTKDDIVTKTAQEVCDGLTDVESKVDAIHNYVYANISYDRKLAKDITSGKIKGYAPIASDVLINKKGVCYDYAILFAAMCRSQGVPCVIEKGYRHGVYHAWNKVYIDDAWQEIDSSVKPDDTLKNEASINKKLINI